MVRRDRVTQSVLDLSADSRVGSRWLAVLVVAAHVAQSGQTATSLPTSERSRVITIRAGARWCSAASPGIRFRHFGRTRSAHRTPPALPPPDRPARRRYARFLVRSSSGAGPSSPTHPTSINRARLLQVRIITAVISDDMSSRIAIADTTRRDREWVCRGERRATSKTNDGCRRFRKTWGYRGFFVADGPVFTRVQARENYLNLCGEPWNMDTRGNPENIEINREIVMHHPVSHPDYSSPRDPRMPAGRRGQPVPGRRYRRA